MTMIHECHACQYGMHDEHVDVPDPGVEGMIGGRWECHCKGECRDRPRPTSKLIEQPPPDTRAFDLLSGLAAYDEDGQR